MIQSRLELQAQRFRVDTTCYPWVAYKGPRFAPTEIQDCLTDAEAELLEALKALLDISPYAHNAADAVIHSQAYAAIGNAEVRR